MPQPKVSIPPYFSGIIALKKDNRLLFKKEYGISNHAHHQRESEERVFCIGSLTKMFTACAILLLEEQKRLHTDDSIEPFFPDCPQASKITVHHLLTHTSGLINYTDCEEIWALRAKGISPTELIETFIKKPLKCSPGSQYFYSNSGYALLGSMIEQISGVSYGRFLKRSIFDPLQMSSTDYGTSLHERSLQGYSLTEQTERVPAPWHHPSFAYAAGGIYSTMDDLLRWDHHLFELSFLTSESLDKMCRLHCFTNEEQTKGYGYGVNVEWLKNCHPPIKHIWHRGRIEGFASLYSRYLETGVTLIILTNNDRLMGVMKDIEEQLLSFLGGCPG